GVGQGGLRHGIGDRHLQPALRERKRERHAHHTPAPDDDVRFPCAHGFSLSLAARARASLIKKQAAKRICTKKRLFLPPISATIPKNQIIPVTYQFAALRHAS